MGFQMDFLQCGSTIPGQKDHLKINIITSDGDSQEYISIDEFIIHYFLHIKIVICGWHVINRGWIEHLPKIRRMKNHDKGAYDVNDTAGVFLDDDAARILIPRIQE